MLVFTYFIPFFLSFAYPPSFQPACMLCDLWFNLAWNSVPLTWFKSVLDHPFKFHLPTTGSLASVPVLANRCVCVCVCVCLCVCVCIYVCLRVRTEVTYNLKVWHECKGYPLRPKKLWNYTWISSENKYPYLHSQFSRISVHIIFPVREPFRQILLPQFAPNTFWYLLSHLQAQQSFPFMA